MMNPTSQYQQFDDAVIGSSPIMLMQAIRLAKAGRRVVVLERNSELGGNWQTAKLDEDDEVEIACHLIEVFPGVYDLLENYSGVPFVRLDVQPIRVTKSGLKVSYFSRPMILASGARLVLGWVRANFDLLRGATVDRNLVINFQTKMKSYFRYQLPGFFGASEMKGPRDGFVDFMTKLCKRASEAGVVTKELDVTALTLTDEKTWLIEAADDVKLVSEIVHSTTSTNLERVAPGRIVAGEKKFVHRVCVVIEVSRDQVETSHTYVAFWADPVIARIARVDRPGIQLPHLRFLVEFHSPDLDSLGDWQKVARDRMVLAGIIPAEAEVRFVGQVDCSFTANIDQFPPGLLDHNFWGYYSTGNLAAGLAAWLRTKLLPIKTRLGARKRVNQYDTSSRSSHLVQRRTYASRRCQRFGSFAHGAIRFECF